MNIIELRNYLLKPGARNKFIEYFKEHFLGSQHVLGAFTPGQFIIKEAADRFFWIRGFDTLLERSQFLPAFYGGEVWKEFGPAANDMMLEWHAVHLLKSIPGNTVVIDKKQEVWVIDYYTAANNRLDQLIDMFKETYIPLYHSYGVSELSLWVSDMTENDFPRLPVYQQGNLLVVITGYNSEAKYEEVVNRLRYIGDELSGKRDELVKASTTLVLYPA